MDDIFETLLHLRKSGRAFCVATVVRTADSTSAKAGAKAAVTDQGDILGHLGGGCVQRAVRQATQEALASGTPRMIRVKPSDKVVAMHDADGVRTFKSGCPSGGTVDLLIEPYRTAPRLAILGESAIATALARHAHLAGFQVCVTVDVPALDAVVFAPEEIEDLGLTADDFVVVASQGRGDLDLLTRALSSPARRVSMVASHRKADSLRQTLRARNVPEARLADLKAPAGVQIHAIDPQDIAISILAEVVAWRNADRQQDRPEADAECRA